MSGPKTGQYQMSLPAVGSWPCWVTIQRLRALTLVSGGRGSVGWVAGWSPMMRGLGRLAISVRASARTLFWSSSGVTRVQVDSTMAV